MWPCQDRLGLRDEAEHKLNGINDLRDAAGWHDSRYVMVVIFPSPLTSDVADMIFRYVGAHPDACDSIDGICDWWLARQCHDDTRRAVASALEQLVASGKMEASTRADGSTVYRAVRTDRH